MLLVYGIDGDGSSARRPTDDLAREEIHDDGEIEPTFPRPEDR
jgi:hypothetical protein